MPERAKAGAETTVTSEYLYRGRVVNLRIDTVRLPNGKTTKREIIEHRGAVAILPLDQAGRIAFVRQFRKPIDRAILEIPAGTLDPSEDVQTCLHRELREETGLVAGKVEHLAGYYSAVGFCTEFIEVYLATDLRQEQTGPDEDEFVEVIWLPLAEAYRMVERGEIVDGKTLVGLLSLRARGIH